MMDEPGECSVLAMQDESTVPEKHCLMQYLKYSGLDTTEWSNAFASEGISTLKELQQIVSEEKGLDKLLRNVNSVKMTNFQEILEQSLDDAVEHEEILHKLGLVQYFPEKITLQTVMKRYTVVVKELSDVPWYFLSKILMLDHRARDDLLPEKEKQSDDQLEDLFADLEDESGTNSNFSDPHPMDILVAIFQCSSNFLRQVLCEKMFMCKLSIPFVLPRFLNRKSLFLLWSLRNIVLEYKKPSGEFSESSMVRSPVSVVSCVRLGNIPRSKSAFLNEILNGQSHSTYFHKECKNGMKSQKLSKGVMELALYLPSVKENTKDQFEEAVTFVNLRGDGQVHKENGRFLQEISDVLLVMVDVRELDKRDVISTLKLIASSNTEMVMMVLKDPNLNFDSKYKEVIRNCINELKTENFKGDIVLDFAQNGEKNIKDLKDEIVVKLKKVLGKNSERNTIEGFKQCAESLNMTVDENTPDFIKSKKMASELIEDIKSDIGAIKTRVLPLQCEPWQAWATLSKEEHRLHKKKPDESLEKYVASLYSQRKELRHTQIKYLQNPGKFFKTFLDNLSGIRDDHRLCYMKWLKLYLDENTRKTLPSLLKQYTMMLDELSQYDKEDVPEVKQKELSTIAKHIEEASFGVEHLIREIGQAYEAVAELGNGTTQNVYDNTEYLQLPQIMAELMLGGYPLELMDGDASYIPLLWVQAVLTKLQQIIGDEKKIFVLSVLGIQSSGKSTLLNTMFGLQFSVAAGRCTRGVYAQLVPLRKDMKYDYMLVVDTEGLRASELGKGKIQHDNEIATFVMGLGDVTLVNIKGENVAEMEDVLQIVVHATLKMKLVNKELTLQPSCIFLHQNVSATDAGQKMKIGQQKFLDTLDKVTRSAGEQEDAPQYTKFNQIIDFDINNHVWYISDLWKGDLPMASTNPGYSERISGVKQTLMTKIMQQKGAHLTGSKLCMRIGDLWKGILCQNFVFNFKNSIALKSYNSLEKKLSDMSWLIKDNALKWLNDNRYRILKHEGQLESLENELIKDIDSCLAVIYDQTKSALAEFFEGNEEKELLEQWRINSELKLKERYSEVLHFSKKQLRRMIEIRKCQVESAIHAQHSENEIRANVKSLAASLKSETNLSGDMLRERFNENWSEWMSSFPTAIEGNADVYKSVVNVLLNEFQQDQALLRQIIEEYHRKRIANNFAVCLQRDLVHESSLKKSRKLSSVAEGKYEENGQKVKELQVKIESDIKEKRWLDFTEEFADYLIGLVAEMVDHMIHPDEKFKSADEIRVKMSVYACQLATYELSKIHKLEVLKPSDKGEGVCRIDAIDIHPSFKNALHRKFSNYHKVVSQTVEECCMLFKGSILDFEVRNYHVTQKNKAKGLKMNIMEVKKHVQKILEEIKSDIEEMEPQLFREDHAVRVIRKLNDLVEKSEISKENHKFTKKFKAEISVHVCMSAIPDFNCKNKVFIDNVDPRTIFEKNKKETFFKMLENHLQDSRSEQAFADILAQRLSKVIESMVYLDMPRKLAKEVRCNVPQLHRKASLLPAVLRGLLDTHSFEEYFLHLKDLNGSLDKWVEIYVNSHIFQKVSKSGKTRYMEMASQEINSLISRFCDAADKAQDETLLRNNNDVFQYWLKEVQKGILKEMPITESEVLSLAKDYRISDLKSFTAFLKTRLKGSHEGLIEVFEGHSKAYFESAHEDTVYSIISKECKGCTARCPFCNAPCSLSMENHIQQNIKHKTLEHYPLACGGMRWEDNNELLTENCSLLVAGDLEFCNADTDYRPHLYMDYRKLYPDWDIVADPTVEATPYWKWFLKEFGKQLAEKYEAELHDIPDGWKTINIEMARRSLTR